MMRRDMVKRLFSVSPLTEYHVPQYHVSNHHVPQYHVASYAV
jgi:hypothetical protein